MLIVVEGRGEGGGGKRQMLNEDGVENTLGTTNDSFSLFCMKNYFGSKAARC